MSYYILLKSGDRINITKNDFELIQRRLRNNIQRNLVLESEETILAGAMLFIGIEKVGATKKVK